MKAIRYLLIALILIGVLYCMNYAAIQLLFIHPSYKNIPPTAMMYIIIGFFTWLGAGAVIGLHILFAIIWLFTGKWYLW